MQCRKLRLFVCVFLTMALVTFSAFMSVDQAAAEDKTIKIGVLAALTGFASAAEVHQRDGAVMAVDWINENGGVTINGEKYKLEAVVEDNQSTAEGAKAAAEKLVYDHKVKFIAGATIPYINIAAGSVTEPAKVIRALNYVCETPQELNKNMPYTFKANPAVLDGIGPSLDYLVEKYPKVKTIGVITPEDGAERYLIPICEKAAEKRGLKQVGAVAWPHDTVDFYPKVTDLLKSKPDAIFLVNGYEAATGPIIKAAREQGFKGPMPMANYDNPYDIVAIAGKDLVAPFWTHGWSSNLDDPITPEMKLVIKAAQEKLGKFHQWNLWGWNEIWLLAQAIEAAQSVDPTEVANTWRKMDSLKTVYGPGKMGGEKTYGVKNAVCAPIAITEVLPDGTVKHIKWVDVYIP